MLWKLDRTVRCVHLMLTPVVKRVLTVELDLSCKQLDQRSLEEEFQP